MLNNVSEITFKTEEGSLTILNPNIEDVLAGTATEDILPLLDYYEVKEWVSQQEREKMEADE